MPRPTKPRRVESEPAVTYFKPAGTPMKDLEEVCLGVDEVEALRLKDLLGLEQEECAGRMNLAQSTFQRLLASARLKVSRALIQGRAIRIEGGNYLVCKSELTCRECGLEWPGCGKGRGQGYGHRHGHQHSCPSCGSQDIGESLTDKVPEPESKKT